MGIEQDLLALEFQYWQAIKDKDVDAALRLSDEPCTIVGAQGVGSVDRKMLASILQSGSYTLRHFEFMDPRVRLLNEDVAIVAYKVREEVTVEGEPLSFEAAESSTWTRRKGSWVCSLHTEAIAGDPFGRDRREVAAFAR